MKELTVNDLLNACNELKKNGYGDKKILISADDEGNYFHELFCLFQTDNLDEWEENGALPSGIDINDYVMLG